MFRYAYGLRHGYRRMRLASGGEDTARYANAQHDMSCIFARGLVDGSSMLFTTVR